MTIDKIGEHEEYCVCHDDRLWHCNNCEKSYQMSVEPKSTHSCFKTLRERIDAVEEKRSDYTRGIWRLMLAVTAIDGRIGVFSDRLDFLERSVAKILRKRCFEDYANDGPECKVRRQDNLDDFNSDVHHYRFLQDEEDTSIMSNVVNNISNYVIERLPTDNGVRYNPNDQRHRVPVNVTIEAVVGPLPRQPSPLPQIEPRDLPSERRIQRLARHILDNMPQVQPLPDGTYAMDAGNFENLRTAILNATGDSSSEDEDDPYPRMSVSPQNHQPIYRTLNPVDFNGLSVSTERIMSEFAEVQRSANTRRVIDTITLEDSDDGNRSDISEDEVPDMV